MFLLILFSFVTSEGMALVGKSYDREQVRKIYPGFGEEYIIFPGESGGEIRGYLKQNILTRSWGPQVENMEENMFFVYYNRPTGPIGTQSEIQLKTSTFLANTAAKVELHLMNFHAEALRVLGISAIPDGIKFHNFSDLLQHFQENKDVKLITHGWLSSSNADYAIETKNAYLNKSDVNVIIMDWNIVAGSVLYPAVMLVTPRVATYYATFLNFLVNNLNVDPKDMHLIGHSLGAHVSGFAGRQVHRGKVGRITALDPALPGFVPLPLYGNVLKEKHLNANDSEFVDVIHTCSGFLGFKDPIGHADFYPNGGGPPQPGCGILKFVEVCSHMRSWELFVNTIRSEIPFIASHCSSLDYLENGNCEGDEIPMGEITPATARGVYYTTTTGCAPYIHVKKDS